MISYKSATCNKRFKANNNFLDVPPSFSAFDQKTNSQTAAAPTSTTLSKIEPLAGSSNTIFTNIKSTTTYLPKNNTASAFMSKDTSIAFPPTSLINNTGCESQSTPSSSSTTSSSSISVNSHTSSILASKATSSANISNINPYDNNLKQSTSLVGSKYPSPISTSSTNSTTTITVSFNNAKIPNVFGSCLNSFRLGKETYSLTNNSKICSNSDKTEQLIPQTRLVSSIAAPSTKPPALVSLSSNSQIKETTTNKTSFSASLDINGSTRPIKKPVRKLFKN